MDKIQAFLQSAGNKVSALSIPNYHVPEGVWILVACVLLGIVLGVAFVSHSRARFAEKHLRHKMKSSAAKAVHFDPVAKKVFVVTASGETEIPRKPYAHGTLPAAGYEGFAPREILGGAFRLGKQPFVEISSWKTRRFFGRRHWRIEPKSGSPVITDAPQRPKREDRSKAVTAAAPSGNNRDHRPERDKRPEQESAPATVN